MNDVVASKIRYIGTCNELNAAYAADGYARLRGIGALASTYAVGELSALNGVAGSYAESVPVVCIVGCPARRYYEDMPLLHHTLGDYDIPAKMYQHITCAQTVLHDPHSAAFEIDRVLRECLRQKRPVYIGVPSDMVAMSIPLVDESHRKSFVPLPLPVSDPEVLAEALDEISAKLSKSKQPLFIPGVEIDRRGLHQDISNLIQRANVPYVTMLLSKSILHECNDHFIGLYSGDRSRPAVRDYVDGSDCIVLFGEKLTDFNTGGFTAVFDPKIRVYVGYDFVRVANHSYHNVYIHDVLKGLMERVKPFDAGSISHPCARDGCVHRRRPSSAKFPAGEKLTMNGFFRRMAPYLPDNCVVMAETGASLFSAAETQLPPGTTFIGQTFYGSIGYTVGGCLGASVAAARACRRVFLFVGDGSFQVTAQDLSTMIRYKCNPVVFLVNNDGYTIERVITDNIYNDIQPWKYSQLPVVFGGNPGTVCETHGQLDEALRKTCTTPDELHFIEIILDRWDCNELLKTAGKVMARNNNLIPNPPVSSTNSPMIHPVTCEKH
eukprot:Protomagalhaensia_wolfi_Nauph_80__3025@NODE_309_length_2834_cov_46_852952_g232_i0_p1_GENE_NODE_309_length_2834_cov_46_852952_g232_i0NODE_309_length_2834_cov_46_852952_g232_i0_p1_ORF_typecomplete_len599_score108_25TPP_enzyme_N/PF02776_18/8e42TPP_enzyme_C/PF02775_21/1_1e03TPP_enzyme_C/PF02775_21/7_9e30TPP_enzyme_M/PF00205_22/6_2e16CO_dh/PF02552_16/0_097Transketolase_N/PF00456_21/0_15_NODE_309_length_2834_cov_46_852952_g232_i01461798